MKKKKIKIYFAAALFSTAEQNYNKKVAESLIQLGYDVYLPQEECSTATTPLDIFKRCVLGVDICDILVTVLEGTDVDSGTAWEIGRAYTQGKLTIGIRTDFREHGDDGGLNLMISQSCDVIFNEKNISKLVKQINQFIKEGEV